MITQQTYASARPLNGTMPLLLAGRRVIIRGGPFSAVAKAVPSRATLCLDIHSAPAVYSARWVLAVPDFKTPQNHHAVESVLEDMVRMILATPPDEIVMLGVGCAGGFGRTGLFLALLARLAGKVDPVGYVRENYNPRAVETPEQEAYVDDFPLDAVSALLVRPWRERAAAWFRGLLSRD